MADITTWAELDAIRTDLAGTHRLMNSLDSSSVGYDTYAGPLANAGAGWSPIGTFTGSLDGQGYTISGLNINRPSTSTVGLFSIASGTITATHLAEVDITGQQYVGGLIAYASGATITSCSVSGAVQGTSNIGGLVGLAVPAYTSNTHTDCVITSTQAGWDANTGAFGGYWYGGTVTQCSARGQVTAVGGDVGGFIGFLRDGDVSQCFADVDVEGDEHVGGFIGLQYVPITDCYARGSVEGTDSVGGLIGRSQEDIGYCYATGQVTGLTNVGGLIGVFTGTEVTSSFWDTQTSGQAASDGGEGRITAQMKQLGTFSAWSIARTTAANPTGGYPFLGWQIGLTNTWLIYGAGGAISPRIFVPIEDKVSLELVRNVEMSAGGRAFIDKEGKFHYDSRFGRVV